jgi:hypothetical protein
MFTRTFSVGRTRVPGRAVSLVLALGLVVGALLLAGCPMEDDDTGEGGPGIDPKLVGAWQYNFPDYESGGVQYKGGYDKYTIETVGEDHKLIYTTDYGFGESIPFAGKIAYAYRFDDASGVIIIEYDKNHKQVWYDYSNYPDYAPLDPQPEGNFYGVYYAKLNSAGTEVLFANTSDQTKAMGPTEAKTLNEAIEKFSLASMNQFIDLSQGNPLQKINP